jgi:zinc transport system permease protein
VNWLSFSFMQRALLAGFMVGIICPLMGSFLVLRNMTLIADTLSHVALAGVALALLIGIYPLWGALAATVFAAFFVEKLRRSKGLGGDLAIGVVLSGGLALGAILLSLRNLNSLDLFGFLFGNILAVTRLDLILIWLLGGIVLLAVWRLYRPLLAVTFDEEAAKARGLPVVKLNGILMLLAALTVALAMRMVGVLLISSLMVIPVAVGLKLGGSFRSFLIIASATGVISALLGLLLAAILNLAPGGSIVLVSLGLLGLAFIVKGQ